MKILHVRDKLLICAFAIATFVALASSVTVSLVIEQQHQNQATKILKKAERDIQDDLQSIKNELLSSSERLATQHNFGPTIWYLSQYAKSAFNREILASTYSQLAIDTYRLGKEANLYKVNIYDAKGQLVSFAVFKKNKDQVGYIEQIPHPLFQSVSLEKTENIGSQVFQEMKILPHQNIQLKENISSLPTTRYVIYDGILSIETKVPIVGMTFNPNSKAQEKTILGLISTVKTLNQEWASKISRLTDTEINVFTNKNFSTGMLSQYDRPNVDINRLKNASSILFNELSSNGKNYYQGIIPLTSNQELIGSIAILYSKEIVQKNIQEMRKVLALIAITCLLFIFPFAWYFFSSISKPITQLSKIFQDLASGKRIHEIDGAIIQIEEAQKRDDELGFLAQSFVTMSNAIRQKMNEINEINASLESRVEESTAKLRVINTEMEKLANTDSLTGLHNRRAFFEIVNFAYSQMKRNNTPMSLIMLDLDNFKLINDQHGHPAGDEVLRCVARCLLETARESDYPARIGGEEFAILSINTDVNAAYILAERIRTEISFIRLQFNEKNIPITASLGVASLQKEETFSQLYVRADAALYSAKEAGRNCTKTNT
jgi:diguanylate cyclase (GGDEF)-like protein